MHESLIEAVFSALVLIEPWDLTEPKGLPHDLLQLADPMDPLAQARLWGAIYSDLPRGFLVETCIVESGGCKRPVGLHEADAWLGASAWPGVWQRKRVDHTCEYYVPPDDASAEFLKSVATHGNAGLVVAYHLPLVGRCVPPSAFDVPLVTMWAAAEKARRVCTKLKAKRKRCTRERLRCAWAQAKLGSSQCGRVIKRFRTRLAEHLQANPSLDPSKRYTLAHFRKHVRVQSDPMETQDAD